MGATFVIFQILFAPVILIGIIADILIDPGKYIESFSGFIEMLLSYIPSLF